MRNLLAGRRGRTCLGLVLVGTVGLLLGALPAAANTSPQTLPFSQNWTNTGLITTNDDWSGVPGIEGYLGQGITAGTGTDPQTLLTTSLLPNDLDVIANQTDPAVLTTGGVAEFDGITNPTIALQGSGTANAPYVIFTLNTTGLSNVSAAYNLRDIDGSTDNAVQPVALQYRVGTSGSFTNVPAGFVADATSGPSQATLVTAVNASLPAAVNDQPVVQVRVMTANAVGSDEWVGVDDISIATATTVTVASATATRTTKGVLFRWHTGTEADLLGFQVYRSTGHSWQRITRSLIGAKGSVSGASYRFLDKSAKRGVPYRYRIKALNRDGSASWFGPVRVM